MRRNPAGRVIFGLAICAVAAVAAAQPAPTATTDPAALAPPESLAVLDLTAESKELVAPAQALSVLIATRLSGLGLRVVARDQIRAALGVEQQRALLGDGRESRIASLAAALGVRYLLFGRLDRFGSKIIVTSAVLDTTSAQALVRMRRDVASEDELPGASDGVADESARALFRALGRPLPMELTPKIEMPPLPPTVAPTTWHLNFKLGNTLPALAGFTFEGFVLKTDLEFDWYLTPAVLAYIEAGLVVGRATDSTRGGTFSLVPVSAGAKYQFRGDHELRPYLGAGLGFGILSAFFGGEQGEVGVNVKAVGGVAWFPFPRVGFNLEASSNLASLTLNEGTSVYFGFNTNFGVILLF